MHVAGFQTGHGRVGVRFLDDDDGVEPTALAGSLFLVHGFDFNFDNAGDFDLNGRADARHFDDFGLLLDNFRLGDDTGDLDDLLAAASGHKPTHQYK